jgi:predicted Zn finger-like uncharacterized protein
MKFVCDRCQTKYSIADDKVRGKVLKVRCKTCQNVITVREAGAKPSVGSLAPVRPSQRPSQDLAPLAHNPQENIERTSIAPAPAELMADMLSNQPRRPTPPPPPPLGGDGVEWFLALEGAQHGPFTRKLLVDRLVGLPKDADAHVWNDRMDGWKPPKDVPEIAHALAVRGPPLPVRPPVPRGTPAPPVPPLAARRGSGPLPTGVGGKLPIPAPHVAAAHAVPAPHGAIEDPGATPPPLNAHGAIPAATNGHAKSNGLSGRAPAAAYPGGESDALSALNIGGAAGAPFGRAAGAPFGGAKSPPRIMEVGEATSWAGAGRIQEGRHRNTKMMLVAFAVVAVMIVVIAVSFTRRSPATVAANAAKGGLDSDSLGKLNDLVTVEKVTVSPIRPDPPVEPPRGKLRGRSIKKPGRTGAAPAAPDTSGGATADEAPPPPPSAFKERSITPYSAPVAARPPPSQADITRVIANNKIGIKTCYQRALLRDSSLTHGKIVVGVNIGLSGRVKGVRVDGPMSFHALEPCIKEMVYRWAFPAASEEYGTEFSYVFQGNE